MDLPKLLSHIDLMLARETKQVTWLEARVKESSGKPEEPKLRKSLADSQKLETLASNPQKQDKSYGPPNLRL